MPRLLCFGLGYSARALARNLAAEGWKVTGTSRSGGDGCRRFNRDYRLRPSVFAGTTHILVSIPPDENGDAVLDTHERAIAALPDLEWLGYLSTTGVYGNRNGGWVDETSALNPSSSRAADRAATEICWLAQRRNRGVPVHIFRLAGIYGPGRSAFDALRAGTARRFDRPGQVFSRIHVDDIANVLRGSIARPRPGAIYNVCDDEPAAPADVIAHAAELLDISAPPLEPFEPASMSRMARSFWLDNKRVSNTLIKQELGVVLRYPDFRAGLAGILAAGG